MKIFDIPKTHFISHRGFTPLAPENSLPSFYYAGLLGQWAIETDVHMTRDGEIVCCHNDTLDKYCNGVGKIAEMSYSELRRFEIVNGNRVECFNKEERANGSRLPPCLSRYRFCAFIQAGKLAAPFCLRRPVLVCMAADSIEESVVCPFHVLHSPPLIALLFLLLS